MSALDIGLSGSHVLITGAAGGIGLATARLLLEQGARVTCHFHSQSASLESLQVEYPDLCFQVQANATEEKEVVSAVSQANDRFGTIHVLVCNHATYVDEPVPVKDMTLEQWRQTLDVNLTGYFLFVREFLRQLDSVDSQTNVAVVMIGSTAGKFGEAQHADYATSKSGAMYGLMKSLKNEIVDIAPRGRVNCVQPGWTLTEMAKEAVRTGKHLKALQTTPLAKIAQPLDVAMAVLTLASPVLGGHLTGSIIEVDGGMEGRVLNSLDKLSSGTE